MFKKLFKTIIPYILIFVIVVSPIYADDISDIEGVSDIEQENIILQQQLEEEEAVVAELQANISDIESYIDAINQEMDKILGLIEDYELQKEEKKLKVDELKKQIEVLEKKIEEDEESIQCEYSMMKLRIKYFYENTGDSYIESIFSSTSFSEVATKARYMIDTVKYDRKQMQKLQKMVEEVTKTKEEMRRNITVMENEIIGIDNLESAQNEQRALYEEVSAMKKNELEIEKQALDDALGVRDVLAGEIASNQGQIDSLINAYNEMLAAKEVERAAQEEARAIAEAEEAARRAEFEEESRRIEAENESKRLAYEEESRRAEEEKEAARLAWEEESRRLEEEASESGIEVEIPEYEEPYVEEPTEPEYEEIPTYEEPSTDYDYGYSNGGWIWPLSGYYSISSYFGYRDDDDLPDVAKQHEGIDIPCPNGTPILAVDDGIVVVDNWSPYIGYYMVVYHGNNLFSEMHHMCQPSAVGVGAYVSQGDVIGYTGDTGEYCYGAHLHFGVCVGADSWALTNYADPLAFLP